MDYCDDSSSYNNHNNITKGGICYNSDWSYRNGTTTARIAHAIYYASTNAYKALMTKLSKDKIGINLG
jgi:hypothetical protein